MREQNLKTDQQVTFFCSFIHMVFFVVFSHTFSFNFLHGFWSDYFINGKQNCPAVQKRNFDWFAQYGILKSNTLSVHQVGSAATIAGGHMEIWTLWIWRSSHEIDVKVGSWASWLLVAFASELLVVVWIHSGLDLYLFVANRLRSRLAVETYSLFLITYRFDTASVEFLKSCWHLDFNSWHWWELRLINTSVSWAEETSFDLCSTSVAYIEERVIFQEVAIEYLVAILLVDVAAVVGAFLVFDASAEYVDAVLVVNCFPLSYICQQLDYFQNVTYDC